MNKVTLSVAALAAISVPVQVQAATTQDDVQASYEKLNGKLNAAIRALEAYHSDVKAIYLDKLSEVQGELNAALKASEDAVAAGKDPIAIDEDGFGKKISDYQSEAAKLEAEYVAYDRIYADFYGAETGLNDVYTLALAQVQNGDYPHFGPIKKAWLEGEELGFAALKADVDAFDPNKYNVANQQNNINQRINEMRGSIKSMIESIGDLETNFANNKSAYETIVKKIEGLKASYNEQLQGILVILPGDPAVYGNMQAKAIDELNEQYRLIVEVQNKNKEAYDNEKANDQLDENSKALDNIAGVVKNLCEKYTNLKNGLEDANNGFLSQIETLESNLQVVTDELTSRNLTELNTDVNTINTKLQDIKANLLEAYKSYTVADAEYETTFDGKYDAIEELITALDKNAKPLCANYDAYQDCLTQYNTVEKALDDAIAAADKKSDDLQYNAVGYFNTAATSNDIGTLKLTIESQYIAKTAVDFKENTIADLLSPINTFIEGYKADTKAALDAYNNASKEITDSEALVAELEKVEDKTVTVDGKLGSETYQAVINSANSQIKAIKDKIASAKKAEDGEHKERMNAAYELSVRADLQELIDNYDKYKKEFDKNYSIYAAGKMLAETKTSIDNINKRIDELTNGNTEEKYGNGSAKITEELGKINSGDLATATKKYDDENTKYNGLATDEEKAAEAPVAIALLNEVNNTLSEVVKAIEALEAQAAVYEANKAAYDRVSAMAAADSDLATFIANAKTFIQNNTTAADGTTFFLAEVAKQETRLTTVRGQINTSYSKFKSVETEEGYTAELNDIKKKVQEYKDDAVRNDNAYKTIVTKIDDLQKYWQEKYTKISEQDQSSIAKDYLAQLGTQQDAINKLKNETVPGDLKTGKCDDNQSTIEAEIERINGEIKKIAEAQEEGYIPAIAHDNLVEHNKYCTAYSDAYKVFQNAVESLNKLSSITNAAKETALEKYIGTHDAIYKYAEELRKSSATELAAYNEVVSPDLYSAETEIVKVQGFAAAIDQELQKYQDAVNAEALANYKSLIEQAVITLSEYESSISGYHTDNKTDAFNDVHEFVDAAQTAAGLKDGASVSRMFAYEIDSWLNKLEANTVRNMCIADREAAATKEFNYYKNSFETLYKDEKADIEALEGIDVSEYTDGLKTLKENTIDAAYNQFFYNTRLSKFDTLESVLEMLNKYFGEDKIRDHSDVWAEALVNSEKAVANNEAYDRIIGYLNTANEVYNDALEALKPLYVAHQNGTWLDSQLNGILAKIEGYQQSAESWKSAQTCVDNELEVQVWVNAKIYESIQQTLESIKAEAINIEISTLSDECNIVEEKYNQVIKLDESYIGEWSKKWSAEITTLYKTLLTSSKVLTNVKTSIEYRWNNGTLTFEEAKAELVKLEAEIARVGTTFTDIYDNAAYGLAVDAVNDKADIVNQNIAQLEAWVGDEFTAVTEKYSAEVENVRGLFNFVAAEVESKDAAHQVLFYKDNLIADYDDVQKVVDGITPGLQAMYEKYLYNKSAKSKYDNDIASFKAEFERVKTEIADFEFSHDYTYVENGKTYTTTYRNYMINLITKQFTDTEAIVNEKYEKVELTGNDGISTGYINYLIGQLETTAKYDEATNTYLPNVEKQLDKAKANMDLEGRKYNAARKTALVNEYERIETLLGYAETYNNDAYNSGSVYKDLDGNKVGYGDWGIRVSYLGEPDDQYSGGWLRVKSRAEVLLAAAKTLVSDVDEYYYITGDADNDKRVTVNDYSEIRSWILDALTFAQVHESKAYGGDVNEDGEFTVADMTGISNIIFHGEWDWRPAKASARARAMASAEDKLTVTNESEETTIFGKTVRMAINLDNSEAFSAGQMDIILPQGMKLAGQSLSTRANGHEVLANQIGNGVYRLVASTVENNEFNGSNGALIYLDVEVGSDYNGGNILVDNVIFSDTQANSYYLTNNGPIVPTGINGIEAASVKERIYSVGGQMMKAVKKGINIIVGENNKTQKVVK